ncbi:helix-turn-helix transcriptional regulator [Marinomonas pollencensis]|uniref:DNA-binding XRE family transcriptional regulator n=1 Tax=Marinomonas pollencensis TaxID=491954 RepID=A0A3E0DLW0_9GAMM|nr:helix-turn-helix domain-containing protein [Marinomonas pollencensis]REG83673.1 DNA-binding XRE family transcriptional regulator [Marinomonas pollencensis]
MMKMKGQIESIYPIKEHKLKHKAAKKAKKKGKKAEQALAVKRAELKQQETIKKATQEDTQQTRASKNSQPLDNQEKKKTMKNIISRMMAGELSQGEALKMLRIQVLGLKQEDYAQLVGVSRKTLSENENNKGNYSADVVNKVFQPFGLKVGLVTIS